MLRSKALPGFSSVQRARPVVSDTTQHRPTICKPLKLISPRDFTIYPGQVATVRCKVNVHLNSNEEIAIIKVRRFLAKHSGAIILDGVILESTSEVEVYITTLAEPVFLKAGQYFANIHILKSRSL